VKRSLFGVLVVLLAATACGKEGNLATSTPPARASYPMSVTSAGTSVTIPARPHRIVSLSATATQMVFAIGAGRQVVAVDQYSTYPKSAPRTKLSEFQPNVEAIAAYRPDLLLIDSDQGGLVKSMAALHVPVLVLPAAENLDGSYAQIAELGRVTDHVSSASSEISRMRRRIAAIVASVPKTSLRVYHELDQTYFTATSATFIGQIYSMFGLRNVADAAGRTKNSGYPQLSSEYIVSADPQIVVLADTVCCHQSATTVASRPGWSRIDAVKHGEVIAVNDSLASQWGPSIVDYISLVAQSVRHAEATYRTA
jgi:iron complex transport system substrate-binding protein